MAAPRYNRVPRYTCRGTKCPVRSITSEYCRCFNRPDMRRPRRRAEIAWRHSDDIRRDNAEEWTYGANALSLSLSLSVCLSVIMKTTAQICLRIFRRNYLSWRLSFRYSAMRRPGVEPATCWLQVQRPNHSATEPHISTTSLLGFILEVL